MEHDFKVGDFAERLEDHPLVKAGEVHEVIETFRGGYLGFKRPVGGEWNPRGWRKIQRTPAHDPPRRYEGDNPARDECRCGGRLGDMAPAPE